MYCLAAPSVGAKEEGHFDDTEASFLNNASNKNILTAPLIHAASQWESTSISKIITSWAVQVHISTAFIM